MLQLPSTLKSIPALDAFVKRIAEQYHINQETYGDILVSLTEAVTNAISHGNHYDESKTVKIQMRKQPGAIAIRVSDQGCGFDYRGIPDPTCAQNICKCGGRGVFLMHELSDRVRFHDNGRTVEMQFKI